MSISAYLDGFEHIDNFTLAYVGPGVYVLYDGPRHDRNIVYIGKSISEVLMRVRAHRHPSDPRIEAKDFDRVGVILPDRVSSPFIHNLEHYVIAEFKDRFGGEKPKYNRNDAHLLEGGPTFNWHTIARRDEDVEFAEGEREIGREGIVPPRTRLAVRTMGDVVAAVERLASRFEIDQAWEVVARQLGGVYTPATLRVYASTRHGNWKLPRLS